MGERHAAAGADPLAWERLDEADAVYFTAGDAGAVRRARAARSLVATARALVPLAEARVELDALVSSGRDEGERYEPEMLDPEPRLVVRTAGADGGTWERPGAAAGRYAATEPPGPVQDSYGCGDSFAGGLTYALGAGMDVPDALELAARCGAACLTGRGPYSAQLMVGD
jgi:ribokinase